MKNTKLLAVLLNVLLVCGGCSENPSLGDAINEFEDNCKDKLIAELHSNTWSKGITLKCNDFDIHKAN